MHTPYLNPYTSLGRDFISLMEELKEEMKASEWVVTYSKVTPITEITHGGARYCVDDGIGIKFKDLKKVPNPSKVKTRVQKFLSRTRDDYILYYTKKISSTLIKSTFKSIEEVSPVIHNIPRDCVDVGPDGIFIQISRKDYWHIYIKGEKRESHENLLQEDRKILDFIDALLVRGLWLDFLKAERIDEEIVYPQFSLSVQNGNLVLSVESQIRNPEMVHEKYRKDLTVLSSKLLDYLERWKSLFLSRLGVELRKMVAGLGYAVQGELQFESKVKKNLSIYMAFSWPIKEETMHENRVIPPSQTEKKKRGRKPKDPDLYKISMDLYGKMSPLLEMFKGKAKELGGYDVDIDINPSPISIAYKVDYRPGEGYANVIFDEQKTKILAIDLLPVEETDRKKISQAFDTLDNIKNLPLGQDIVRSIIEKAFGIKSDTVELPADILEVSIRSRTGLKDNVLSYSITVTIPKATIQLPLPDSFRIEMSAFTDSLIESDLFFNSMDSIMISNTYERVMDPEIFQKSKFNYPYYVIEAQPKGEKVLFGLSFRLRWSNARFVLKKGQGRPSNSDVAEVLGALEEKTAPLRHQQEVEEAIKEAAEKEIKEGQLAALFDALDLKDVSVKTVVIKWEDIRFIDGAIGFLASPSEVLYHGDSLPSIIHQIDASVQGTENPSDSPSDAVEE